MNSYDVLNDLFNDPPDFLACEKVILYTIYGYGKMQKSI